MLRRKQEELALIRRSQRSRTSKDGAAGWERMSRWLQRAGAARALAGELEAALERALAERGRAAGQPERLDYLRATINHIQGQIMQLEDENVEAELGPLVATLEVSRRLGRTGASPDVVSAADHTRPRYRWAPRAGTRSSRWRCWY